MSRWRGLNWIIFGGIIDKRCRLVRCWSQLYDSLVRMFIFEIFRHPNGEVLG